jgi:peptide/nickel transport system permease protein
MISFAIIKMAPGDPAAQKFGGIGQASAGMDAQRGTEAAEKRFREKYHLDDPLPVQFTYFLRRLLHFRTDLISFQQEKPIWPDLVEALKVTISINLIVFFLIYLFAVPIGILSAAFPRSWGDRLTTFGLFALYSLPSFWMAEMLRIWFSGPDRLPIMGLHADNAAAMSTGEWMWDMFLHLILPVTCMTYGGLAYISRQMRAGMLEVIRQDYIRTAAAKGAGKTRLILVHALRNGLFPIITLFASLLPFLIGGSVIIETIFNIPGMGRYAFEGVLRREYDIVMATLTLSAIMTLFGILVADILYVLVNPQVTFDNRS